MPLEFYANNLKDFVRDREIREILPEVKRAHKMLVSKSGLGAGFLGWFDLPNRTSKEDLKNIKSVAREIKENTDAFVCIGIGGSYLGARATIEFLQPIFSVDKKKPQIYYAGCNLSSDYLQGLLNEIKDKDVTVNVISKSGTTTEPALTFRIIQNFLKSKYSKADLQKRIICTTDNKKGALLKIAEKEGYRRFIIPEDVGGRFSVLTPVGLLPIAVAGVDIEELLAGAKDFEVKTAGMNLKSNIAYLYAAIRNILYRKGMHIEILANFHPALHFVCEWWKQLFGESEGKDGKGIFPAAVDFTTDLHSMGQLIQEGARNIFETFLVVSQSHETVLIPFREEDLDQFNCVAGKDIDFVNEKAHIATAAAHFEAGVPNMTISIPERKPYYLGQLFYFFEKAVAISGYILGVNPFNQPGVEVYKKKMFQLLGRI
jgi:glucose-6-phosphate isomerase